MRTIIEQPLMNESNSYNNTFDQNYYYDKMDFNNLEMRLLMIGDHSMYEKFLEMYNSDEFVAYNALYQYLNAIYEQVKKIYLFF